MLSPRQENNSSSKLSDSEKLVSEARAELLDIASWGKNGDEAKNKKRAKHVSQL